MLLQLASLFAAILSVLTVPQPPNSEFRIQNSEFSGTPALSVQSSFLIDTASGTILHARNADEVRPIASITKLMTALVMLDVIQDNVEPGLVPGRLSAGVSRNGGAQGPTLRSLRWLDYITFEAQDRRNGGIPYLIPGEEITVRDVWRLMLVGSSNDAAQLLARTTEESLALSGVTKLSFVQMMNEKARALGFKRTVFTDPTGLDAGNVSTARETAALLRLALSYSEIRNALGIRQFQFAPRGRAPRLVRSTNWLAGSSAISGARSFGGKTGHIEESGYNLAFSAGRNDHELLGVVLGAESNEARFAEMRELLNWGLTVSK